MQLQVAVAGSRRVTDGLGLELEPSDTTFWTRSVPALLSGPSMDTNVAVFDAGAAAGPLHWPLLTQGPPGSAGRLAAGWSVDTSDWGALEQAYAFFVNR